MAPNGENIIHVTLTPGEYGLYCFVDDAKDGKMHVEHGMVSSSRSSKRATSLTGDRLQATGDWN